MMEVRVDNHPDPVDVIRVEDRVRDETLAASGLDAEEELVVFARQDGQLIGGGAAVRPGAVPAS